MSIEIGSAEALAGERLDVLIVGAGIVGLAIAHKLQAEGRRVVLVDRKGIAEEASKGNAGAFAFSDILPLATSGKIWKVPGWLLDPLGPLTIQPTYLPAIVPYLMRFWREGWPDKVAASVAAQSAMMRLSIRETAALVAAAGLDTLLRSDGSLEVYESEAEFAASQKGWAAREKEGIPFEHVRGARMAELQPGLSPRFVAGTFSPSWQTVSDPSEFALALAGSIAAAGGRFVSGAVAALVPGADAVGATLAGGITLTAETVVVAAGAWSKTLTAPLGDRLPLETERGYNTTLPHGAFDLKRMLIFGGHGFVISSLTSGLRIGGAVEFGGLELPPNYRRSEAMLKKAKAFLPELRTEGGTQWMGFRPSLPDSLPAIGFSRASKRIVYAFGHGHLGLTQAAGTGRLVAELLSGRTPSIDLTPFSPQRF